MGERQQSAGSIITYGAAGLITLHVMGSRKSGWAKYAPLRRYKGGEARTADLNRKKRKHGRLRFFLPLGPRLRSGAAPPPLSRGRTGLRPEPDHMLLEACGYVQLFFMWAGGGSKPLLFSYKRGKPGGEGEGQYMPPPHRHRSTMGLKVAWPWAGLLRRVPTVFCIADKCSGMRGRCGNGGRAAGQYAPPPVWLLGEAAGGVRGLPRYGAGGRPLKGVPGIGVTADKCG
jgi:hypothetical protein